MFKSQKYRCKKGEMRVGIESTTENYTMLPISNTHFATPVPEQVLRYSNIGGSKTDPNTNTRIYV